MSLRKKLIPTEILNKYCGTGEIPTNRGPICSSNYYDSKQKKYIRTGIKLPRLLLFHCMDCGNWV